MDLGMFGQSELLKIISWTPWKTVGQFIIYYQKLYVACTYVKSTCVHIWVYLWYVWGWITVLLLYIQLYIQAFSWQFWEEFGVLSLCYHEVLCQTQLLHSVPAIIYARFPYSCLPGASIQGAWSRTGPLYLQHACQRPCSHASEHRRNHTHNQNKLPSSAWFMYLFWEEICFTTIRRKSDAFKHQSEKHIILSFVCTMACSWTDGPEDVLS